MEDSTDYCEYLRKRSRVGLYYRKFYLYPILSRHLKGLTLDVGCGIGDMLSFRKNTIGVDINPDNVYFCRGKGLNALLIPDHNLPFKDCFFKSAIMDNVLEHIDDPIPLLKEIFRVLENSGSFIVGVPGRLGFSRDNDHKVYYDEQMLIDKIVNNGFLFIKSFYTPIKSKWIEKRMPQYCLYGVFKKL